MVYVKWKYFNAVSKGKGVADRKVLWWDARHDCVTVAKISNWSADSMLQLHHQAMQLREL